MPPTAVTPDKPSVNVETAAVTIQGFAFAPAALTVKKGTTVIWTNLDAAPHLVVADVAVAGAPYFSSPSLATGASYSFTFNQVGVFSYFCQVHPRMRATVTVTE